MSQSPEAAGGRPGAGRGGSCPPPSRREAELLAVTLEVLRENGYDRLTVDEVAARAHASKATVYRRWPSKADLVLAAFAHGIRQVAVPPGTGTLRGDLMRLAELIAAHACQHGTAIAGILPEIHRNPRLRAAFEEEFGHQRRVLIHAVLHSAAARGEIAPQAISDEIWDVLPGYLVFRGLVPGRPPTPATGRALVDEVLLPSLTRYASPAAAAHPCPPPALEHEPAASPRAAGGSPSEAATGQASCKEDEG